MPETQEATQNETRNDPAFEITEVNTATGEVYVVIQRGILGAIANQLKSTSDKRKGASILRKLGYVLSDCGDIQYGGDVAETDIDPNIVVDVADEQ